MNIASPESGFIQAVHPPSVPSLQTELGFQAPQTALAACMWLYATACLAQEMGTHNQFPDEEPLLQGNEEAGVEGTLVQAVSLSGEASQNYETTLRCGNPCLPERVSGRADRRRNRENIQEMACAAPPQLTEGVPCVPNAGLRTTCQDVGTQTPSSHMSDEMKETQTQSDPLTGSSDFSLRCCWMAGWFAGYLQHAPQGLQE